MAYQFLDGRFRAETDAGLPAAGYKLYTYVSGTTTNKPTYTDSTLGGANTNPVVLNARGEAQVWLTTGAYTFVLKTAADVTVWTVDGIQDPSTIEQDTVVDLFDGTGSQTGFTLSQAPGSAFNLDVEVDGFSLVPSVDYNVSGTALTISTAPPSGVDNVVAKHLAEAVSSVGDATTIAYTQGGVGAVERTVSERLRDSIHLLDYATGSGVETSQIVNALNEASSTGRPLEVNAGYTFRCAAGQVVSGGIILVGGGTIAFDASSQFGLLIDPPRTVSTSVTAITSPFTYPAGTGVESGSAQLTVSSAAGFAVGRKCHLRSDDKFSWDATANKGELVEITDISGTTIYLAAPLLHSYSSGIVLEQLNDAVVEIDGPTFTYDGDPLSISATPTRFMAVAIQGAVNPRVRATFRDDVCAGLGLLSCWRPDVDVVAKRLRTSATVQYYGYGVIAYGSTRAGTYNIKADSVRHAYSTGVWPTSTEKIRWGTVADDVVSGVCTNPQMAGWDTHPGAMNVTFLNPVTIGALTNTDQPDKNSSAGFQDRGLNTKFINPISIGTRRPFFFTAGGTTYGVNNTTQVIGGYHERRGTTATSLCNPSKSGSDNYTVEFNGGKVVGYVPVQSQAGYTILKFDGTEFVGDATANGLNASNSSGGMMFRGCTFREWSIMRLGQSNDHKFIGCQRINESGTFIEPMTPGVGSTIDLANYYAEAASYGSSSIVRAGAGSDAGTVTINLSGSLSAKNYSYGSHFSTNGTATLALNTGGVTRQPVAKKNTTANRPTLRAEDIGYLYLDTTLDADGKPIWWNGSAWVDATGAVV